MKKLKKGMTFENMKVLLQYLDLPIDKGNTRKKNLKYIDSICEYEKNGHKIFITKVYNKPKEIKEKRGSHFAKYNQQMAILLYHALKLYSYQDKPIVKTKIELIQLCFPRSFREILDIYKSNSSQKKYLKKMFGELISFMV